MDILLYMKWTKSLNVYFSQTNCINISSMICLRHFSITQWNLCVSFLKLHFVTLIKKNTTGYAFYYM